MLLYTFDKLSQIAALDGVLGNVLGNNCTRCHNCVFTNCYAEQNRGSPPIQALRQMIFQCFINLLSLQIQSYFSDGSFTFGAKSFTK